MTAQFPDKLVNKHPRVKLAGRRLYGVIRGDPRTSRNGWGDGPAFVTPPARPDAAIRCSALWRGYVATFVLEPDGRLRLSTFEYMLSIHEWQKQEVDELIDGDFWVVMKPAFFGPRTYIPFRDGVVVEDQEAWFTEEPFGVRMRRRREGQQAAEPGATADRGPSSDS